MKLWQLLLLGVALLDRTDALVCSVDEDFNDITDYSYTIPHDPKDLEYWRSFHLMYYWFGKFGAGDNQQIIAKYEKADGEVIYQVEINCKAGTWQTSKQSKNEESEEFSLQPYKSGNLAKACEKGIWDLTLKVEQRYIMKWIFNGQGLEDKIVETIGKGVSRIERVYPGFSSSSAAKAVIKTSGGAVISRFAFGKCVAWPHEITENCAEVKAYLLQRSKFMSVKNDDQGNGPKGAYNQVFSVECLSTNPRYYLWIQQNVHPDKSSYKPSCCCTDMKTGRVPDVNALCQSTAVKSCSLRCLETYDSDIVAQNYESSEEAAKDTLAP